MRQAAPHPVPTISPYQGFLDRARPLFEWVYEHYFRVEASGLESLPPGPMLLVSNHGGFIPWDGAMIHVAVWKQTGRHPRFLVTPWAFTIPGLSQLLSRSGNVPALPRIALELLKAGEIVGTFPEGVPGVAKPIWRRYRPERFGRGFARTALQTGVPIIPISVVGSEDAYPIIANWRWLGRKLGGEALPITLFWPWLGPLGLLPLPVKWVIRFHPPVNVPPGSPAEAQDRTAVAQLVRRVQETIVRGVQEGLRRRRFIFFSNG